MKRTVIFKDKENNRVVFDAEIKEGRFSASGEYCGGLGQVFDNVSPRTEAQAKLIELWQKWHLNDMKAGTVKQEDYLKNCGYNLAEYAQHGHKSYYDFGCHLLDMAGLLVDDGYKYGSAWLRRDLPEDFADTLNALMDDIEEEEGENKDRLVEKSDIDLFDGFSKPETALALAIMFGLSINEIDDIEEGRGYYWTVQGIDYLAGDDNEMDEAWNDELDNYIDECVEIPAHIEPYFDRERWKDDARIDGRGHALNRYNGGEEEAEVDGVWYYAYRQ